MARTVRVRRGKRSRPAIRRRRTLRRYRRNRRTRSTISKMPTTVVPDRLITKLRVTDTMFLNNFHIPDSTTDNDQFSYQDLLLSVSNPFSVYGVVNDDIPAGLQTWSGFYNEVAVLSARVKVTPLSWKIPNITQQNFRGGASMPYSVCLCPVKTGNVISSSVIDFMEQPYSRYKFFTQAGGYLQVQVPGTAPNSSLYSAQSGNSVERSVVNYMTSKKIMNYKDIMDQDATLWIETTPPTVGSSWGFVCTVKSGIPWDGTVGHEPEFTLPGLYMRVDVTYSLMFRNRKTIVDDV